MPKLFKQIDSPPESVRADGLHDKMAVYEVMETHTASRSPQVVIPPK